MPAPTRTVPATSGKAQRPVKFTCGQAARAGPFPGHPVAGTAGGRREELAERLVAVVLVPGVGQRQRPGHRGQARRVGRVQAASATGNSRLTAPGRARSAASQTATLRQRTAAASRTGSCRSLSHTMVGSLLPDGVAGDEFVLAVQVAGVARGCRTAWCCARGSASAIPGTARRYRAARRPRRSGRRRSWPASPGRGCAGGTRCRARRRSAPSMRVRRWLRPPSGVSVMPGPRNPQKL